MKVGDLVKYVGNRTLFGYSIYEPYLVLSPEDAINIVFTIIGESGQTSWDIKDSKGTRYNNVSKVYLSLFNEALLVLSEQELTRINKLNHV